MRKALLLGGIVLLIAAVSFAGQRTRGSSPALRGDAGESTPTYRWVAPGVGQYTTAQGEDVTVNADGTMVLDQILGDYDSWEHYQFVIEADRVGSTMFEGELITKSNLVGNFAATSEGGQGSINSHKQEVDFAETEGRLVFVDGVVFPETDSVSFDRDGVPHAPFLGEDMYADGTVVLE